MMRLVDDDQFRFFHHIIVMPCEPLYGHHPDAPVSQTCSVFCNGLFYLFHKFPAVCDDPDRPLSISEKTAYHRRQYMGLAGTCRHLHHHAAVRPPFLRETLYNIFLIVMQTYGFCHIVFD